MTSTRDCTSFALGAILLCLSLSGHALVTQSVNAQYTPASGPVVNDSDSVDNTATGSIDRNILASIRGSFGNASASAGVFGDVGVEAFFVGGDGDSLSTSVRIESDEFVNLTGVPQRAVASFIIDGGLIDMTAGLGSTVEYSISITSFVFDAAGDVFDLAGFDSVGLLESTDPFGSSADFTPSLADIGATQVSPTRVEIPLSLQSFDVGVFEGGIVPAGGHVELTYLLRFASSVQGFAEGIFWEFSDPGNIEGFGDFPTVEFTPVGDVGVPEPATAALLALAALLAGVCRRTRRISARDHAARCA